MHLSVDIWHGTCAIRTLIVIYTVVIKKFRTITITSVDGAVQRHVVRHDVLGRSDPYGLQRSATDRAQSRAHILWMRFPDRKETLHRIAREAKQSDGENIANEVRGVTI
jgi:hypothetical protein